MSNTCRQLSEKTLNYRTIYRTILFCAGKRVISPVVWLISDIGKRGNYTPFICAVRGEPEKELGSQALLERLKVTLVWDFVARWRGFAARRGLG